MLSQLESELKKARKELGRHGPRIGSIWRWERIEATTSQTMNVLAIQRAHAWIAVLIALARASFLDAIYGVQEAAKALRYVETPSEDEKIAWALGEACLVERRQKREAARMALKLVHQLDPENPETVPAGFPGDDWMLYNLLCTIVRRAARRARKARESLMEDSDEIIIADFPKKPDV